MVLAGLAVLAVAAVAVEPHGPGAGAPGRAPAPGVGALYFGEGAGSPPPSPEAGDFLEHNPRQVAGDGTFGRLEPERREASPRLPLKPPPADRARRFWRGRAASDGNSARPDRARRFWRGRAASDGNSARPDRAPEPRRQDGFLKRDPASRRTRPSGQRALEPEENSPGTSATVAPLSDLPPQDRRRYSLWEGLSTPLELPPDKIRDVSADQASQLGRRDYDAHILGARPVVAGGELDAAPAEGGAEGEAAPRLFVCLDLKPEAAAEASGGLKDAVAELSRSAGFHADERFGAQGRRVWGWIPARRLGELLASSVVERVETGAARGRAGASPLTEVLLGIRIRPGAAAAAAQGPQPEAGASSPQAPSERGESFARVSRELEEATGFRSKGVVGYQAVPRSRDLALIVVGEVPLRNLSRLLAHSDVLKVAPAPAIPARGRAEEARPSRFARFLAFVAERSPLLLILTLLVLLPPLGGVLARLVQVFVPYH